MFLPLVTLTQFGQLAAWGVPSVHGDDTCPALAGALSDKQAGAGLALLARQVQPPFSGPAGSAEIFKTLNIYSVF